MQSTLQSVRPSSHSSLHSSGSIGSYGKRRISSTQQNGSKGVLNHAYINFMNSLKRRISNVLFYVSPIQKSTVYC